MLSKNKNKNKNKIGGATGTINFPNKNVYVGDVKEEEGHQIPHGRGKMSFANGATYEGDYVDGRMEGEGHLIFPSGLSYNGQMKNNKFNGKGEIRFDSGSIYDGQIQDNHRHGEGKMKYPNGRVFTGKWNKGQILNQYKWRKNKPETTTGTMTDSNGRNAVTGYWTNIDTQNPIISKKIVNNTYKGEICLNKAKPHGIGKMRFENGDEYNGAWKNGKMHGKGVYKYSDGKIFEGNWINGERERETGKYKLPSNAELDDDDDDDDDA